MLPYFIAFGISIIFSLLGERLNNKSSLLSNLCYIVSVFVVAVLAALRNLYIGTDVQTYVVWEFEAAIESTSLIDFVVSKADNIEPLYSVVTYLVACFTSNVHWLLFVIGVITYGFTMSGLCKYKNIISVWMGWACFLFLFYGDTLNMIRQSIAMSILFFGFHYLLENKEKKFWFSFFVAYFFHNSAIIFLIIYALYKILVLNNSSLLNIVIVLMLMITVCYYTVFLEMLMDLGVLPIKFARYIADGFRVSINLIILRLPFILFILLFYKQFTCFDKENKKVESTLYILVLIFDLILCQLRNVLIPLYRVSMYFGIYKLVAYSRIYYITKNKVFMGIFLLTFLVVLWIYQNVIQGNNEIYPYTSRILGI